MLEHFAKSYRITMSSVSIDWNSDPNSVRKQLLKLNKRQLIKLCKKNKVPSTGSKSDMINALITKKKNKTSSSSKKKKKSNTKSKKKQKKINTVDKNDMNDTKPSITPIASVTTESVATPNDPELVETVITENEVEEKSDNTTSIRNDNAIFQTVSTVGAIKRACNALERYYGCLQQEYVKDKFFIWCDENGLEDADILDEAQYSDDDESVLVNFDEDGSFPLTVRMELDDRSRQKQVFKVIKRCILEPDIIWKNKDIEIPLENAPVIADKHGVFCHLESKNDDVTYSWSCRAYKDTFVKSMDIVSFWKQRREESNLIKFNKKALKYDDYVQQNHRILNQGKKAKDLYIGKSHRVYLNRMPQIIAQINDVNIADDFKSYMNNYFEKYNQYEIKQDILDYTKDNKGKINYLLSPNKNLASISVFDQDKLTPRIKEKMDKNYNFHCWLPTIFEVNSENRVEVCGDIHNLDKYKFSRLHNEFIPKIMDQMLPSFSIITGIIHILDFNILICTIHFLSFQYRNKFS